MSFANLHTQMFQSGTNSVVRPIWIVASSALFALNFSNVNAQTLIEEVELPKPVVLQSGVPIPELQDAARRAVVTDDAEQSERQHYTGVREYQLGTSTIREYRYGEQLMYVEVVNETGSTFVVEHSHPYKSDTRKPRSGVVVTTW